ncbi:cilia- and flagella-associated protein 251-like [Microplitis demolitor]|uniref:cilia- and flagella-associated protein 251-like n=1 Tax=Microplitis demolitor TaxID=69319 RepID=UPI00235B66D6|nr:cilia- and flagella-associated protein 251-like [Microplitis demolitor]
MREWSLENEVERFVSEARTRQDKKDKTNEEWRRQEKEKLIEEKPKKINGNELEEELKERKQKRARGDEGGEITYVGGDEESLGSVIDLILTLDRGDEQEIEVRVVERIESDHLPVLARYKVKRNEEESKEGSCISEEEEQEKIGANKLIWKKEKIQEYAEATQEALTEALEEKSELEWEDTKEIVRKGAEKTGMVMKGKKDKDTKEKEKWYNIEGKKKEKKFRGRKKRAASNSIKAKQWEKHFSDLLNGEGNEESEEKENEPWKGEGSNEGSEELKLDENFSRREVKAAIRKLGNHKAPGEDGMAAEFIKNSAPDVIEWIGEIINKIWDEGSMPE